MTARDTAAKGAAETKDADGTGRRRADRRPSWAVDPDAEGKGSRNKGSADDAVAGRRREAAAASSSLRVADLVRGRLGVLVSVAVACVVEMLPGVPGALLTVAGLWLLFGAPIALWRGVASRVVSTRDGSLLLAAGMAIITDIVVALAVNTVLPLFGVDRPLTQVSLAGATALTLTVIGAFAPEEERAEREPRAFWRRGGLPPGAVPVAGLAAVALLLSVAGPIRLNNGLGGSVSMAALIAIAALLVLLMIRRWRYPVAVLETGLFLAATALLLLNSLRGWSITGHDVQREYEYFRLTLGGSLWDISTYPDAYNACLSITLLPMSVFRLTAIPDVYIFKIVLPVLFALTPVLIHRSVRNIAPHLVSLLSAVLFMIFPTFLSDMTFLGRQEVAFVLLGCAMVVLTDSGRPLRVRRIAFVALLAGITLSHYSTIYVIVAILGVAVATDLVWRLAERFRAARGHKRKHRPAEAGSFVTWWIVAGAAAMALVWAGPVTHTSGQLRTTLDDVVQTVLHPGKSEGGGSSDTSYSLFGGTSMTAQQRLDAYRTESLRKTAKGRAEGLYLPLETVDAYNTPVVGKQNMPLTAAGRALDAVGVDVGTLNSLLRQSAAAMFQLLLGVGLLVVVLRRRGAFRPVRDQTTLTIGAVVMLGLLTVIPSLSADYGVLRAFQQGLFFFAPFIAAGLLAALRWAGRRRMVITYALIVALFLDLTGVVPKLLGGYPAQLQLSNSGQYYDIYYPTTEERNAAYWLVQRFDAEGKQSLVQTDRFTFNRQQTTITGPAVGDLFPTALRTDAYVLVGSTTVRSGTVTFSYEGDLVTYRYPTRLLDTTKNVIYSSEGARIYR
ncbi:DUF2206 domain-containing protein [Streptomyces spongiae]|uniref:DUF2206 domain-containing protein n=1 Tax=Streptomyces spongiae TaxID=565072 RepID=A0A5N8XGS1_9ACTN|nr:DUF2206 domain-containing protein [Streptomyces spongiae]MPY58700.1 DUF2206 domain-containing protein [Streptomyces spongiae]